ncbi:alcohol dehydrogenase catalytic domain-containing protein [Streptomyces sp. NPDC021093]|uniref:alcohol dehydrogenase catalytic domain-containing protein n=1 Tax=Streptomyces sp. NPDC021093 TaxID=3365112 RepID=UPI0037BCBEFA
MSGGPEHRALVREGQQVLVRRLPTPRPAPGEILVAPQVAGVCGTDLQMLRGLRDDAAPVLGHEGLARTVAVGPGVGGEFAPGTPVVVNPTHPTDPTFLLGHNVNGLWQERTLIPANAVHGGQVIALERAPEAELAALLEPLAVVRYALATLAAFRPRTLIVHGDGTIGQLAVRAARHWLGAGVRTVLVHHTADGLAWSDARPAADRADLRLLKGRDQVRTVRTISADGPTAVLLATPRDATLHCLEEAVAAAGEDTTVDVLGGLPPLATTPLLPGIDLNAVRAANCAGLPDPARWVRTRTSTGGQVRLIGHRGVGNFHLRAAAAELSHAPDRYRDLVTHCVGIEEAAPLLSRLAQSRDRMVDGRRLIKLAVRLTPAHTASAHASSAHASSAHTPTEN